MIKLTDLIDEIDLRTGPLDIPEEDTVNFFLDEFGFPEDAFDTKEDEIEYAVKKIAQSVQYLKKLRGSL